MYTTSECLAGGLMDPMNSTAQFSTGCNATTRCRGNSSLLEGLPVLWHTSQDLA
nr:hypothetical protein Q903MT_gene699 [Picea sitchensis]